MPCVHLKQLYHVCESHNLKLSSSDLIRITCPECGLQETCPSVHMTELDTEEGPDDNKSDMEGDE